MKVKSSYIFLYMILSFIFIYGLIYFLFLSKDKLEMSNNNVSENLILIDTKVYNNPTKVKISKLNEENEKPFICFISDECKIKEFTTFFDNILFEDLTLNNEFNSICDITFYGDTSIIISLSKDKIIRITKESKGTTEYLKVSNNTYNEIINLVDVKYYLHISNLSEPTSLVCNNARTTVLSGMPKSDISLLRETIHNIHSSLEYHLVERVSILKNVNSIYWEPETENKVFIQPNGVKVQSNGLWKYRDSIQKINNLPINDSLRTIINDIIYKLEQGMNNHDISECFEVHKILHDLDYWIINYPISSLKIAPVDWEGLDCYYGSIENYGLN